MLFNSYIFLFLFFPITILGYFGLNHLKQYKLAYAFLLGMSWWFYGYNNIYYLPILVVSILLNYFFVEGMHKYEHIKNMKKLFLALAICTDLGILFYFKYYDFFIDNMNAIWKTDIDTLGLMLPLGVSFYTFQQISYVIDYYKGECPKYSFLQYATYVSFFPQLIAGPIVYHTELIPQFEKEENKHLQVENFSRGLYAFACGMAKKVLIADVFSRIVTIGYRDTLDLNTPSIILVMLCYAIQIYFDFSGYCDMAYGIGYMFNVVLPINFNSPYKADGIGDFWNRWHMTLNRFFIKYVYIPLGGSRRGTARTYLNSLLVFIISGFWHGANWTYIVWGTVNGIAVAINRAGKSFFDKVPRPVRKAYTFILFLFTLIIFRSSSLTDAFLFMKQLFIGGGGAIYPLFGETFNNLMEVRALYRIGFGPIISQYPSFFLWVYTIIVLLFCFFAKNTQEKVAAMKFNKWEMIAITGMLVWSIMSLTEVSEFLYYNF